MKSELCIILSAQIIFDDKIHLQAEKQCSQRSITANEAFCIDPKQTCFLYKLIRKKASILSHYIYLSYHNLLKRACLPSEYSISETSAKISPQNALN